MPRSADSANATPQGSSPTGKKPKHSPNMVEQDTDVVEISRALKALQKTISQDREDSAQRRAQRQHKRHSRRARQLALEQEKKAQEVRKVEEAKTKELEEASQKAKESELEYQDEKRARLIGFSWMAAIRATVLVVAVVVFLVYAGPILAAGLTAGLAIATVACTAISLFKKWRDHKKLEKLYDTKLAMTRLDLIEKGIDDLVQRPDLSQQVKDEIAVKSTGSIKTIPPLKSKPLDYILAFFDLGSRGVPSSLLAGISGLNAAGDTAAFMSGLEAKEASKLVRESNQRLEKHKVPAGAEDLNAYVEERAAKLLAARQACTLSSERQKAEYDKNLGANRPLSFNSTLIENVGKRPATSSHVDLLHSTTHSHTRHSNRPRSQIGPRIGRRR